MKTYNASEQKWRESKMYLAGGVSSSLRSSMKPVPLFARNAHGSRLYDLDDNEYIDYLLAYGPLILGHSHPVLKTNIFQSMEKGFSYGLQHEGEIELAKMMVELIPCAELVSFSGSGTEAVMLALRLARAHTGKRKIVRFQGHYHGWSDSIFTSFQFTEVKNANQTNKGMMPGTVGQSENSLQDIILLDWNDFDALEFTLRNHSDEIAAVISEPVMCNSGCIKPLPGYLEKMRELTQELNIVFILDEVITGFRLGIGGAHGKLGVLPDLVTVGKALGGGVAISAVAGKKEIMQLIENNKVSHLGTLNGNCIATVAAIATISELIKDSCSIFAHMEKISNRLVDGIRDLLKRNNVMGIVNQIGPVFNMIFTDLSEVTDFHQFQQRDAQKYARFAEYLLEDGVLVRPNGLWYICAVHDAVDVDQTLFAVDRALKRL